MKVLDTPLKGLKIVELDIFKDNRGFFIERFNAKKFAEHGLPVEFSQDNHSRSKPSVIRGLHMQYDPPQGKLVGCLRGRIYDVAVDIRPGSPTLGRHFGLELNEENGKLLWIPGGFAHGFSVLGDSEADVSYKVSEIYNMKGEIGIRYDDPDFAIDWQVKNPIISERDTKMQTFQEYLKNPPQW